MFKEEIISALSKHVEGDVVLESPPDSSMGDFAFPCFALAKSLKKNPVEIAKDLASKIKKPKTVSKIEAKGPYVNFFLDNSSVLNSILSDVLKSKSKYGKSDFGKNKLVAVEFSSPNIGKPMHFGHLRSTVIGHSLSRLHEFCGFKVIRLNYIGDWGTQFGKLIYAYLTWGDEKKFEDCPVKHLVELYVKFNSEAKKNPELDAHARDWFSKLEKGDKMALSLWSKFKHHSLDEFRKIYAMLGVEFDSYNGEAFYAPKAAGAADLLQKKGKAVIDDGALIVRLDGYEMPMMLRKSDESTTYASRDVATLLDRIDSLNFDSILYVVGHEQSLHFKQLFEVVHSLGHKQSFVHVAHGLYLSPSGGKMASRTGQTVFMEDVLNETIALAKKTIEEKNPDLKNKKEIARLVAVGAVFFGDLMNDRVKDVVFDVNRILSFEGDTGPYLMYTHARAYSIVSRSGIKKFSFDAGLLTDESEVRVVKLLSKFPSVVQDSVVQLKPHLVGQFLIELGRAFNEFYHKCPVLGVDDKLMKSRVALVEASRQVLENGLFALGITAPKEM